MAVNQFNNPALTQALENFLADKNNENLVRVSQALVNSPVLIPAKWDKDPKPDEKGQIRFDPDTKISLLVATRSTDDKKFYPMFTSNEAVSKFYQTQDQIGCLVLTLDQYLPFLLSAKGRVDGVVIDPSGLNVPFSTEFLEGIHKAARQKLEPNNLKAGSKVFLRNPEGDTQAIEAALISAGFHEPDIKAIYLKERVDNPEDPKDVHWFVVVDSDLMDTGMLTRIDNMIGKASGGKDIEFTFTKQKLGADIAATTKPLYEKMFN